MLNRILAALAFVVAAAAVAGCPGRENVACTDSTVCRIEPGGQCLAAPDGENVCAYPSTDCPSGFAWSPEAGDLAGECVPASIDAGIVDAGIVDAIPADGRTPDAPPSDGPLPTCTELGCTPLATFCTPEGACTCIPPGGQEVPCTR